MRLIDADTLKKKLQYVYSCDYIDSKSKEGIVSDIIDEIDNAPTVEETEEPFITETRDIAIMENLPLYFVYYEVTGVLEVFITETKELFEKRHCSKHLSNYEFNKIVTDYLDWYLDIRGDEE